MSIVRHATIADAMSVEVIIRLKRKLSQLLPDVAYAQMKLRGVGATQVPIALQVPPAGMVHAPLVRGIALHAVAVPEHTIVPLFWQPPVPAEVHAAPVGRHVPPQLL